MNAANLALELGRPRMVHILIEARETKRREIDH